MKTKADVGLFAVAVLVACGSLSENETTSMQDAEQLVRQFVDAEMNGASDSALSLLSGCSVLPTADYVAPTVSAEILDPIQEGDTIKVSVSYMVLGKTWSLDAADVGEHNTRFETDVRIDQVDFFIRPDDTGRQAIMCTYLPPIHLDLQHMELAVETFDEASRTAWDEAHTLARERGWSVPPP